ncbi:Prion-inhibition and propagation domain containing protein [Hyaloscypha variabilis]
MDPVSLTGLGLGVISLTFQLFSGCLKAYNLLADARGMPAQFQYLRIRVRTEQHRLGNWALVANLTEQSGSLSTSLQLNEALVQEVLREQETILTSFWKVSHPHTLMIDDPKPGPVSGTEGEADLQERVPQSKSSLEDRALRFVEKMRRYPSRIRWSTFDRGRLETSISQLSALNDAMMSLLDSQQQYKFHQAQIRTSMQVLHLNKKVDHLLQLFQANSMQLSMAQFSQNLRLLHSMQLSAYSSEPQEERQTLATLARFKALNVEINLDSDDERSNTSTGIFEQPPLDPRSCTIFSSIPSSYSPEEVRSDGIYENIPVWIEWKYYEPVLHIGHVDPHTQVRISRLSALLSNPQKPTQFHTPSCIGYFNDVSNYRFGLVFRRPIDVSSVGVPSSLFDLIISNERPSLSMRVHLAHTLATAVQYLHSTDWLHKAFRSQNVVFFTNPGDTDISTPYLCGFGLSRPAQNTEMTEQPDSIPLYNLYRHPLAHSSIAVDGKSGFKKAFDVYSLGIVLLELALWMPLYRVLGVDDRNLQRSLQPGVTKKVRELLLRESRYLEMVKASAGDVFADVIRACVEGFGEEGESLHDKVVVRLETISI